MPIITLPNGGIVKHGMQYLAVRRKCVPGDGTYLVGTVRVIRLRLTEHSNRQFAWKIDAVLEEHILDGSLGCAVRMFQKLEGEKKYRGYFTKEDRFTRPGRKLTRKQICELSGLSYFSAAYDWIKEHL